MSDLCSFIFETIPANFCCSWGRLQHVFSVAILRLLRRLEDVLKTSCKTSFLEDVFKTSWRHVLKTSWRYVLKMCWRHDLKMSWRHVLKTSWRHYGGKPKYLLRISVSSKSKCVSSKSTFHKSIYDNSKTNPKCIN